MFEFRPHVATSLEWCAASGGQPIPRRPLFKVSLVKKRYINSPGTAYRLHVMSFHYIIYIYTYIRYPYQGLFSSLAKKSETLPRTTGSPSMEGPTWPSVKTRHRSSQPRFERRCDVISWAMTDDGLCSGLVVWNPRICAERDYVILYTYTCIIIYVWYIHIDK